jgi:hypothetical protein
MNRKWNRKYKGVIISYDRELEPRMVTAIRHISSRVSHPQKFLWRITTKFTAEGVFDTLMEILHEEKYEKDTNGDFKIGLFVCEIGSDIFMTNSNELLQTTNVKGLVEAPSKITRRLTPSRLLRLDKLLSKHAKGQLSGKKVEIKGEKFSVEAFELGKRIHMDGGEAYNISREDAMKLAKQVIIDVKMALRLD